MVNVVNILEGWGKVTGAMEASQEDIALSEKRTAHCLKCKHAKPSRVLEIIRGSVEELDTLYCNKCFCPVLQKSLVQKEKCPENLW